MSTPSKPGPRRPVRSSLGAEQLHARPRPPQSVSAGQVSSENTSLDKPALKGDLGALATASPEELIAALQRERTASHEYQLLAQVHSSDEDLARLRNQVPNLEAALAMAKKREEEALDSQLHLETDLIKRDAQVEQLREAVKKYDRRLQDAERRIEAETHNFEADRQALTDRIKVWQQAPQSAPSGSPALRSHQDPDQDEALRLAEEELELFRAERTWNLAKTNALKNDLATALARIAELEEEAQSWELLMRERTLDGTFSAAGLLDVGAVDEERETVTRNRGVLDTLDESLEIDDLHEGVASLATEEGPRRKEERLVGGESDLASELERAETCRDQGAAGNEDAVQVELKHLRETNKALTLYCSKIIDRIILQEGFEHILSVDYKTRRIESKTRSCIPDALTSKQDDTAGDAGSGNESGPSKQEQKARPLSMMSRAFNLSGASPAAGPRAEPNTDHRSPVGMQGATDPMRSETKSEKRARRVFSLDFRSFGFGSGSSGSGAATAAGGLKTLTLAPQPVDVAARKLEPYEEDEEDLRERHRLEASLKLLGINRSTGQTVSPEVRTDLSTSELRDPLPTSDTPSTQRRARRVSRLSSLLGSHTTGLDLKSESADTRASGHEDTAEQLLQAFDRRERQRADALAKGGNDPTGSESGTYTSPMPAQKRQSAFRRASAVSSRSPARHSKSSVDP